ncbi:hypothetical protein DFH08DRAFT_1033489 [Mycena albidolilacea]|uniref:Uncharacterized protein n=1 Tax=Mycena albidolilacea TaxID=1033008 RepID=A0AAD7EG15_9AGAR|nr:hypothetical protein DFH08DRAFT_1033489 [Mycena albidolilacea]
MTEAVAESRPRKGNESGASKVTKALEAAIKKNKKIEYNLAIDEIFVDCNQKIAELAARFNKDVNEVRATVCCVSQSKVHRKPTLRNGVAHQRSLDLQNQGITKSIKDLYAELDQELENGTFSYRSVDKVEEKRLIDQIDARLTAKQIGDELLDLFERTGVRAFAFVACGHADDLSRAHYVDSDDTLDFFTQGLDMSALHFMRKFEQWSCNLNEGKRVKNGSTAVRKDVSRLITDRLWKAFNFTIARSATKNPKAKMDYVNYDKLHGKYSVKLTGNVPRSRPATWNVDTLRLVRDGLMDSTIDFVPMTPAQVKELAAEQKKQGPYKGKAETGAGRKKSKAVGSEEDSSSEEEEDDDDSSDEEPAGQHSPSPGHVLLGRESIEDPPRRPSNPATCFSTTQIDDMVLAPISSTTPVPASTAALAPISSATPAPASTALLPDPTPIFRIADAFIHDYGALQRNGGDEPFQPKDETHMPPLPSTFSRYSGMNDYIGWDMGMPMGMGLYGSGTDEYGGGMDEGMGRGAYAPSAMWPVLNMPPLSPPAAEKQGCDKVGDGEHHEPAKKRARKENAPRGRGGMHGSRGRNATGESKKKKSATDTGVRVNSVQVITSGLTPEGKLRIGKCLSDPEVEDRVSCGLSAFKTQDKEDLLFSPKWMQQQIDEWFQTVFPRLFKFLDRRHRDEILHWVLVRKSGHMQYVMQRSTFIGEELEEAKGSKARRWPEYSIRIATKHKIPASLVKAGFDHALAKLMTGEELASESESEVELSPGRTVRRKSRKVAPRKRTVAVEEDLSSSECSELDGDEFESAEEDDECRACQRSKSSSFGVADAKKEADHDSLFLDGNDSDLEENSPQYLSAVGSSNKRTAPASFESQGRTKRSRSGSVISHHSLTISINDSPSPHLHPATSSFVYDPDQDPARLGASAFGGTAGTH